MYAIRTCLHIFWGRPQFQVVPKGLKRTPHTWRPYASQGALRFAYTTTNSVTRSEKFGAKARNGGQNEYSAGGNDFNEIQNPATLNDTRRKASAAKIEEMHELASKYSANFPRRGSKGVASPDAGEIVLVTGTTGAFGCNLLAQFLEEPEVVRVYAVNRMQKEGVALRTKQASALKERGMNPGLVDSSKLVLVEADMSAQDLGMSRALLEEVRSSITLIVHNAWPVHFTRPLSSFHPVFRGLRNLVDFALSSPRENPPSMIFVSSIGVCRNYHSSEAIAIPETAMEAGSAVGAGYTESKWVGERILDIASQRTPLRTMSARLGQLSGGVNGAWNTREWVPSLVRSSQVLGCLPARQEDINWLPVNSAATALIEARHSPAPYLTLVHPHPVQWNDIFQPLSRFIGADHVTYLEWVAALENSLPGELTAIAAHRSPALRLLDFFGPGVAENAAATLGLARMSTFEATRASPTLASLKPLTQEDVGQWLAYWRSILFLE